MGTSGPGNIVHIDNLYVKTLNVQDNVSIVIGDFCVIDATSKKLRPLVTTDFSADNTFLVLTSFPVFQAGENANNLNTTEALLRKNQCECITVGSDWVCKMAAGTLPTHAAGILRVDSDTTNPFQISHYLANGTTALVTANSLGQYKHKEFSTIAEISVLADDGVISTGVMSGI